MFPAETRFVPGPLQRLQQAILALRLPMVSRPTARELGTPDQVPRVPVAQHLRAPRAAATPRQLLKIAPAPSPPLQYRSSEARLPVRTTPHKETRLAPLRLKTAGESM